MSDTSYNVLMSGVTRNLQDTLFRGLSENQDKVVDCQYLPYAKILSSLQYFVKSVDHIFSDY